jgi:type IV secretory pathway component VirB8
MVEQISSENVKRVLLEEKEKKISSYPGTYSSKHRSQDIVVENATEKRYLWTARAFAIVFAVSMCLNLILTYVLITISPLYRVEPYLFSFSDKGEQVYNIEPVNKINDYKYLTELFVREYVVSRNTFVNDVEEMEQRWGLDGKVKEYSENNLYNNFYKEFAKPAMDMIRNYNMTRNVKILSVREIAQENGLMWWDVDFRVEDMTPEYETPVVNELTAKVGIRYVAKRNVKFNDRLKNPLGFTVYRYTMERKK